MSTPHATPRAVALDGLPPTITVVQAAALLGIGRNAAYRAAATGELPVVRLGARILVLTAPLRRLLGVEEPVAEQRVA